MRFKTGSAEQTQDVAALMVRELRSGAPRPLVIGMLGDLGSGKTTFIQGFAAALGIGRRLLSPTFLIMRSYRLPHAVAGYERLFHLDAYRLRRRDETEVLGLSDILHDPKNIIFIEWAGNIKSALPQNTIWMKFDHGRHEHERCIEVK